MYASQAIDICDRLYANAVEAGDKLRWLAQLEGRLYLTVHGLHADPPPPPAGEITEQDAAQYALLLAEAYSEIYPQYLIAMCAATDGDINRYNNQLSLYNSLLSEYRCWYKTHHGFRIK